VGSLMLGETVIVIFFKNALFVLEMEGDMIQ
jgi:hypothetical protein